MSTQELQGSGSAKRESDSIFSLLANLDDLQAPGNDRDSETPLDFPRMVLLDTSSRAETPSRNSLPSALQNFLSDLELQTGQNAFLFGKSRTGKTTFASWLRIHVEKLLDRRAQTISASQTYICYKNSLCAPFAKSRNANPNDWERTQTALSTIPVLIVEDIGSIKPSETVHTFYTLFTELRSRRGLVTIYTSQFGPECGPKGRSLDHKIGACAAGRLLDSFVIDCEKIPKSNSFTKSQDPSSYQNDAIPAQPFPEEPVPESNSFRLPSSVKDSTSMLSWITQSPIFRILSTNERAELTVDGQDLDGPVRTFQSPTSTGNTINIFGPVLCQNDQLLYIALLALLASQHRSGTLGVKILTSYTELSKTLQLKGRSSFPALKRQLSRLQRSSISIQSAAQKRSWQGGFISEFVTEEGGKNPKLRITLNESMIEHYCRGLFVNINFSAILKMSSWSRTLYLYVQSLKSDINTIPLVKLAEIGGNPNLHSRLLARAAREALKEQKLLGFQTEDAHVADSKIHSVRATPASIRPI